MFPDLTPFTAPSSSAMETRLLVLASTLKDGEIASRVLTNAQIGCAICGDITALMAQLERGAGALLLAEEVLT